MLSIALVLGALLTGAAWRVLRWRRAASAAQDPHAPHSREAVWIGGGALLAFGACALVSLSSEDAATSLERGVVAADLVLAVALLVLAPNARVVQGGGTSGSSASGRSASGSSASGSSATDDGASPGVTLHAGLQRLAEQVAEASEVRVVVMGLEPDTGLLRVCGASGLSLELVESFDGFPIGPEACSCGTAAFQRRRIVAEDAETDRLWSEHRALAQAHGIRSSLSEPVLDAAGRALGTIGVLGSTPGPQAPRTILAVEEAARAASGLFEAWRTERVGRAPGPDGRSDRLASTELARRARTALTAAHENVASLDGEGEDALARRVVGLGDIQNSIATAERLLDELIASHGTSEFLPRRLQITELVERECAHWTALTPARITLAIELRANDAEVLADEHHMHVAFGRMLESAVESIGDRPGRIEIRLEPRPLANGNPGVALEVEDDGPPYSTTGIDGPLFGARDGRPIVAGKGETSRSKILVTVREIAWMHGGDLEVRSSHGRSRIRWTLPLADVVAASITTPTMDVSADRVSEPARRVRRVLLVEDEPSVLEVSAETLRLEGFDVLVAGSGESALALCRADDRPIDCAIVDAELPGIDGDATMRQILALRPETRAILTSGFPGRACAQIAHAQFLAKPYRGEDLIRLVKQQLLS